MGVSSHLRLQWVIVADLGTDEINPSQRYPTNGPRVSMISHGWRLYQEGAPRMCLIEHGVIMEPENSGQMMDINSLDLVAWACYPCYMEG